jgi:hypothetical protein
MENKIPEKVYKYRDWSNSLHKNILLHNELYLASPKDFNDPFDCRIPKNFIRIIEKGEESYSSNPQLDNDPISFQREYEKQQTEILDKHYGILSMSNKWNGILLWSHYANFHKGFCVGFWEDKLRISGSFARTGIVDYRQEFPYIRPTLEKNQEDRLQRIHIQTTTKSKDWENEGEYRFLKCFFPNEPKSFERLITVPNEVISEVVLGINISPDNKDEIIEICKRKNIPVYQARKVPFKFAIDRELIRIE